MVQLGCALNMMLLCVSDRVSLELMALSLVVGAPGAPKMTSYPLNVQMFDCNDSIFQNLAVLV